MPPQPDFTVSFVIWDDNDEMTEKLSIIGTKRDNRK